MKSLIQVARGYDLPYVSAPSTGTYSHVDLRVHASEIDLIPELRGQPDLKELVGVLNRSRGPFMTHGCALARRPPFEPGGDVPVSEQSRAASHWCTSYVTFSFWELSRNQPNEYVSIYENFTSEASGTEVCFVIQPTYFLTLFEVRQGRKWGDTNATVCLIWVSGWGGTDAVAHSRWRNVTKSLVTFFSDAKKFPDNVSPLGVTVSQHMLIDRYFNPALPAST